MSGYDRNQQIDDFAKQAFEAIHNKQNQTDGVELTKETVAKLSPEIPQRLSSDINHVDYRPDCLRVGVIVNGEERRDCKYYDVAAKVAQFTKGAPDATGATIQPFWRYPETRQQRRARERWEARRK